MFQGDDIRAAADTLQALRAPLLAALQGAVGRLAVDQGQRRQAQAWAAAEMLAVIADVLADDLPGTPEQGLLGSDEPFGHADTEQHLRIERDLAAAAARLTSSEVTPTEATLQAASLALASIAGVLAGIARDRGTGSRDDKADGNG